MMIKNVVFFNTFCGYIIAYIFGKITFWAEQICHFYTLLLFITKFTQKTDNFSKMSMSTFHSIIIHQRSSFISFDRENVGIKILVHFSRGKRVSSKSSSQIIDYV